MIDLSRKRWPLRSGLAICLSFTLAAAVAMCALWTGHADAYTGITKFTTDVSTTQAGGHPDIAIHADFNTRINLDGKLVNPEPGSCNCQDPRDTITHLPTGLIGNPHAIPRCSLADFALIQCPPDSQVGVFLYRDAREGAEGRVAPTYNLVPHPGEAGLTGTVAPVINSLIQTSLTARTGSDYGLDAATTGLLHFFPLPYLEIYLWGNPADHSHDRARFPLPHTTEQNLCLGNVDDTTPFMPEYPNVGCHLPTPSDAANVPFLENPTTCGIPLSAGLDVTYYDETEVHAETPWPATTGCDQLSFNPSMTAKPTTTQADTASGLDIDLKVPQPQSPTVPSTSELRTSRITFPEGFSLNPNAGDGKLACTDAELNFTSNDGAQCPEFAKVGTDEIDSSALPGPIEGGMYIGQPLPNQTFRIFLTADGFDTHVKLKGKVHLDPETGQVISTFEDLPQSPFQEFTFHFFGSERGAYATPAKCGTYPVKAEFVPWDSALQTQTSLSSFTIDSGPNGTPCPGATRPFSPRLQAGTPDNTAGVSSPLALQLKRDDGDQLLSGLTVTLPPGLIQSLRGVSQCPQAALAALFLADHTGLTEQASPACPASSQIGTVIAGSGAGTHQIYNPGKVFLVGPYKGAPLSLAIVVPALGGPYDLGNVVVRAAVYVDPVTARVKAISDSLPQIAQGVPIRLRSFLLNLDRPGFNRTPTNCDPKEIDARASGDEGAVAARSAPYQVANCTNLPFGPKFTLRLTGGLGRRGHPAIHALFRTNPGEANNRSISVTLPKGELLDNSHIGAVCTRTAFASDTCPPGSKLGQVEVTTPLLDEPLKGGIYLRSSQHDLPDMALDLEGLIDIEAVGRIDSVKGRLRTSFEAIPDVAVSQIKFDLAGGSKGLLVNSESLCTETKKATVRMIGQNGASLNAAPSLDVKCDSKSRHKRHIGSARVRAGRHAN